MKKLRHPVVLAILLLVLYVLFEFVFSSSIEAISSYAPYVVELLWVGLVFYTLKKVEWKKGSGMVKPLAICAGIFAGGIAADLGAHKMGMIIPFNYESKEVVLFLLIIGPILEELIFRGGLWRIFETLRFNYVGTVFICAIAFACSHLYLYNAVPESYQPFIAYQGAYTLILGIFCGVLRGNNGLRFAMLAHLLFNFGFWLVR